MPFKFENKWTQTEENRLRRSIKDLYNDMFIDALNRGMTKFDEDRIYDELKKIFIRHASNINGSIEEGEPQAIFLREAKQYVERYVNWIRRHLGRTRSKKSTKRRSKRRSKKSTKRRSKRRSK